MGKKHEMAHDLGVVRDPHHPSYKVPGLLAWFILGLSILGVLAFQRLFFNAARLFAFYLLARLVVMAISYLVGMVRCRTWEARHESGASPGHEAHELQRIDDVHHVVIIPNYMEPMEILRRTLHRLAEQDEAHRHLMVVLAMEEREPASRAKARALCTLFADRFAHLLVTVHPANQPGEIAGKGSNQAWAARQAKRELVDRLGTPIERLTLTSCDADSVLHPRYFAALTRLFAEDSQRYRRFWHAPVFLHSNIWEVPAPIRLLSFFDGATAVARLVTPLLWPLPVSSYTLSFRLADEVGYWDPAVISEDYHMYLRCFFATHGQISLTPIFLPTSADATGGETLWQALVNYYRQEVRHAWGAKDVGYILQQWRHSPGCPFFKKLFLLVQLLHDDLLRSTFWFILALGSLLSSMSHGTYVITLAGPSMASALVQFVNILSAVCPLAIWAIERTRAPSTREGGRLVRLAEEVIAWALLPVITLLFLALPALHAQTKMLFGSELTYRRTPKGIPREEGRGTT